MKINATWHLAHKMPHPPAGGPTLDQRVDWHLRHAKNCSCHPLDGEILKEIKKRGLKV